MLAIAVYLPMLAWGSLWIGLKFRRRRYTSMAALAALVAWCVVPGAVCFAMNMMMHGESSLVTSLSKVVFLMSPAGVVGVTEHASWDEFSGHSPLLAVVVCLLVYGALAGGMCYACLKNADRYLRNE